MGSWRVSKVPKHCCAFNQCQKSLKRKLPPCRKPVPKKL
jgi:hypothetical protein